MSVTWREGVVLVLILMKIGLFAHLAQRFRTPGAAQASVRRLSSRPRWFQGSMAALFMGLIILAEGDAVRLHAGLHPFHPLFRTIVLVGYTLLTAGLVSLTLAVSWDPKPPATRPPGLKTTPAPALDGAAPPLADARMEKRKRRGSAPPAIAPALGGPPRGPRRARGDALVRARPQPM